MRQKKWTGRAVHLQQKMTKPELKRSLSFFVILLTGSWIRLVTLDSSSSLFQNKPIKYHVCKSAPVRTADSHKKKSSVWWGEIQHLVLYRKKCNFGFLTLTLIGHQAEGGLLLPCQLHRLHTEWCIWSKERKWVCGCTGASQSQGEKCAFVILPAVCLSQPLIEF